MITVHWDEVDKVIVHKAVGGNSVEEASRSADEMRALLAVHPDTVGILVDLTDTTAVSGEARDIYTAFIDESKKRCAFFGASPILRIVVKMVFAAAGRTSLMNILNTKEDALAWLKN